MHDLWDHMAASADQVPLTDWQRVLLDERLAAHRAAPEEGRAWQEMFDELQRRFR